MNRMFDGRFGLLLTFLLATATVAGCQVEKGMAGLQWFAGHWSCAGKFETSGKAIEADLWFEPVLENRWMLFHHDDHPPFSYHALSEWGWDEKGSRYVSTVQDSGGGVRAFYSPGFSNSRLVWEGGLWGASAGSSSVPAERFEFTKIDLNTFTVSYFVQKDGQWKTVDTSSCKRKM